MDNHVMYTGHQENLDTYNKMTETVKNLNPNALDSTSEIKPEVKEKISQYATDTLKRESKFSLNGNRMTVFKPDDNRDWADEYIKYGNGYDEINSIR